MSNFESKKVNPRTTEIYLWSKIVRKTKIQELLEQLLSAKWPDTYVKTADKFQLMWKQLVYFSWYENSWQIYVEVKIADKFQLINFNWQISANVKIYDEKQYVQNKLKGNN